MNRRLLHLPACLPMPRVFAPDGSEREVLPERMASLPARAADAEREIGATRPLL